MKKYLLLSAILLLFVQGFSQKKVYKNIVNNPKNVYFNIRVDTQIVKSPIGVKPKMYLLDYLGIKGISPLTGKPSEKVTCILTLGNPDGEIVRDADWDVEFKYGYDTAYFEEPKSFLGFDKFGIRDRFTTYSKDKKHISFKASYLGANRNLTLIVIVPYWKNGEITLHRLGKLF